VISRKRSGHARLVSTGMGPSLLEMSSISDYQPVNEERNFLRILYGIKI